LPGETGSPVPSAAKRLRWVEAEEEQEEFGRWQKAATEHEEVVEDEEEAEQEEWDEENELEGREFDIPIPQWRQAIFANRAAGGTSVERTPQRAP